MQSKARSHTPFLLAKAWLLVSAVLSNLIPSKGQKLQAFEMLSDEDAMPPYELVPVEDLIEYQVVSFQEVNGNSTVTGVGVLGFTLKHITTQERLLCKEEDCCEARNYSYENIDLSSEIEYFPPCSMSELLDILKQNCSVVPFAQTIPDEVFSQNLSSVCSYYTVYNQSNLSKAMLECVQHVFEQRWPGYCEEKSSEAHIFIAISSLVFILPFLISTTLLSALVKREGAKTSGLYLLFLTLPVCCIWMTEYEIATYSILGLNYVLPNILNEHNLPIEPFSQGGLSISVSYVVLVYVLVRIVGLFFSPKVARSLPDQLKCKKKSKRIIDNSNLKQMYVSSALNDFYVLAYSALKSISMFVLTLEFYASEFGATENQTLVLAGSVLMAIVSGVKNLRELNFLKMLDYASLDLTSKQGLCISFLSSFQDKNDYLCRVYPKIHALIISLLAPVVFSSFLSTFSSMTVTAGSSFTMQTLSYMAFVSLNYCVSIIGEDDHNFHLAYETLMTAMESWAFMHTAFVNLQTHEQSIDQVVYYEEYSNEAVTFSALVMPMCVIYMYYQLSASHFIPELLKASVRQVKADRYKSLTSWRESFRSQGQGNVDAEDGDEREHACVSFHVLRQNAQAILLAALENDSASIANLLKPAVEVALGSKIFYRYLCDQAVVEVGVSYDDFRGLSENYIQKEEVYKHYLKHGLSQKSIDGGYAHPAVLQALAQAQGVILRMWHCDESGSLRHHREGECDYTVYRPVGILNPLGLDILFVGGYHFELIESGSGGRALQEGDKEFKKYLSHQGIQVERIPLSRAETIYFHQGFGGNQDNRRYELMITSHRSQKQKVDDLNRLSEAEYLKVVSKTIAGGYFVDKVINYFCPKAQDDSGDHHGHGKNTEPLTLVTVQKVKRKKQAEDGLDNSGSGSGSDSDSDLDSGSGEDDTGARELEEKELTIHVKLGEDVEGHNILGIHGPTMLAIFVTLGLGAVPFLMNLNDAVNAVKGCLADLHDSSYLNCSSECFNHYPSEIDVQDIGSSWLVISCYLLVGYVMFKTYIMDRQQTREKRDHAEEHGEDEEKKAIRHQRLRLASLLYYTAVALISFSIGGVALRKWKPAFDVSEQFGMNCSGDAPFRDTKRHLDIAGRLCVAIGGVISSALLTHIIAMSIREKGQCFSQVRCQRGAEPRTHDDADDERYHDVMDRPGQSEADSLLADDGCSNVGGSGASLRDSGLTDSPLQVGIELQAMERGDGGVNSEPEDGDVAGEGAVQQQQFPAVSRALSQKSLLSAHSTFVVSVDGDDRSAHVLDHEVSMPHGPASTNFLGNMAGSGASSSSVGGSEREVHASAV